MFRTCTALALLAAPAAAADPPAPETFKAHTKEVVALAFAPGGKQLASGSLDGTVVVWDLGTGKAAHTLKGHTGKVYAVAYRGDGTLATAGSDTVIRLWDPATGRELRQLKGHDKAVAALDFAPDGKLLASGSYDGGVRLWDPDKGEEVRRLNGPKGRVTAVAFSADGKQLVSGGVASENIGVGGNTIVTGVADRLWLWGVADGKPVRRFEHRGGTARFGPGGKTVIAGGLVPEVIQAGGGVSFDGFHQVTAIAVETGQSAFAVKWNGDALAVSADGKLLATGAGTEVHYTDFGVIAHNGVNGRNLDTRLRLWDAAAGKELARLEEKEASVLAFAPDGRRLAAGRADGAVLVWPVEALVKEK